MQYEQSGGADTVNGFCAKHKISRTKLYDSDLIDGLLRVLRSPHSERLRELLKEIANA
jgi:hypothetical protein